MILVSILLLLATASLLALLPEKRVKDRWRRVLDLLVALVATFCGVAWAFDVAEKSWRAVERDAVVGLLKTARLDVLQTAGQLAEYAAIDTVLSPRLSDHFVTVTPIPSAATLDAVLQSELVLKHISPMTFKVVTGIRGTINAVKELARDAPDPRDKRKAYAMSGSHARVLRP